MKHAHIIIFCRVVDYFGDAGFCWRLCGALCAEGAEGAAGPARVTLVIDRVNILNELRGTQQWPGVTVLPWDSAQAQWESEGVPAEHQADLLIEAFACHPPAVYLQALSPAARWLTLDYLATEPWADAVNGQLSPVPRLTSEIASTRRWVVPGFSAGSAGLLHGQWRHISGDERNAWRHRLVGHAVSERTLLVMAFGYGDAPWPALQRLMAKELPPGFQAVHFWTPKGIEYSQAEFDQILQACDFNFVRGEDSFIRAHWAAAGPWQVPFVWQPYRQEEQAHRHKLAGWMHQVIRHPALQALEAFHWAWNGLHPSEPHQGAASEEAQGAAADLTALHHTWRSLALDWAAVKAHLQQACLAVAARPSLEEYLLKVTASLTARPRP